MKSILKALFISVFFTSLAFAQTQSAADVEQSMDALSAAIIAADQKALDSMTMNEIMYAHSDGRVQNKKEFIDALVTGKSAFMPQTQKLLFHFYLEINRHFCVLFAKLTPYILYLRTLPPSLYIIPNGNHLFCSCFWCLMKYRPAWAAPEACSLFSRPESFPMCWSLEKPSAEECRSQLSFHPVKS